MQRWRRKRADAREGSLSGPRTAAEPTTQASQARIPTSRPALGTLGTERAGFEPATEKLTRTRFPVALLRPLGHLSAGGRSVAVESERGGVAARARLRQLRRDRLGARVLRRRARRATRRSRCWTRRGRTGSRARHGRRVRRRSQRALDRRVAARARRYGAALTTKVFHSVEGDPADPASRPRGSAASSRAASSGSASSGSTSTSSTSPTAHAARRHARRARRSSRAAARRRVRRCNVDTEREAPRRAQLARFEWVQNSYSLLDRARTRRRPATVRPPRLGFTGVRPARRRLADREVPARQRAPAARGMAMRPEPYRRYEDDAVYAGSTLRPRARHAAPTRRRWRSPGCSPTSASTRDRVGPRRPEHLDPAVRALELRLTPAEREELAASSPSEPASRRRRTRPRPGSAPRGSP